MHRLGPPVCLLLFFWTAGCGDLNLGVWTPDGEDADGEPRAAVLVGAGAMSRPIDADISDDDRYLYVADAGKDHIFKFDLEYTTGTAELVWEVGNTGIDTLEFNDPQGIAVGADGSLYVADSGNARIQQLSSTGEFVREWGEPQPGTCAGLLEAPTGVAVDGAGNVYVSDVGNDKVFKFSSQGVCQDEWGGPGSGSGLFADPADIAVDTARASVYVVDRGNRRVQVFGLDGTFKASFGSLGTADGQFQDPWGTALEADGKVNVSDRTLNRLQRFSSAQVLLFADGEVNDALGALDSPSGLVVNSGFLYVCEPDKARVRRMKWTSSGLE